VKEQCAVHQAQQDSAILLLKTIDGAVADSVSGFPFVIYSAFPRSVT